jgi:hypothetical protein
VSHSARKFAALGVAGLLLATSLVFAAPAQAADATVTLDAADDFVFQNNDGTLERLHVDEATGNISRNGALFVHTTGSNSTFVGGAGSSTTTGHDNSAFAEFALGDNTTGSNNSAFARLALGGNTTGNNNSAFAEFALGDNTTGSSNSAFGRYALSNNTTSDSNSAFGTNALRIITTGSDNSAFGRYALHKNTTADRNSAFGYSALFNIETGVDNAAFGHNALRTGDGFFQGSGEGSGNRNSAFGQDALRDNDASNNSAFGYRALYRNRGSEHIGDDGGTSNAAFGQTALRNNNWGDYNSGFGRGALYANAGSNKNAAFGRDALRNATNRHNTAIGDQAGMNLTSGEHNIYINNPGQAIETGQIRIGGPNQTETFIYGIWTNPLSGQAVKISSEHKLGTNVSSIRFKEAVRDMGEASELLTKLRPVTFRYREAVVNGEAIDEYGLIAEEVAKVAPELVTFDAEGDPYSVRYHILPSLLLNQNQKQQRTLEEQQRVIKALTGRLDSIEQLLAARSADAEL